MPKYAALLRAINVGGHTVKMDHLRSLFESLNFQNVKTFIASGNVIFDSDLTDITGLEKTIEHCLHKQLGDQVTTFIRTIAELADISHYKPFSDEDLKLETNTLYIAFLKNPPSNEVKQKILALSTEVDSFYISKQELYWLCRTKISDSKISGALLEKTLGNQITVRNLNTVTKIASKYL